MDWIIQTAAPLLGALEIVGGLALMAGFFISNFAIMLVILAPIALVGALSQLQEQKRLGGVSND